MKKERTNHERGRIFSKWHAGCCGLMLVGGMLCSCPPATAQEPQRGDVTISVKGVSLLQALQELNRRYDNRVMFKKEEVEKAGTTVTVDLSRTSLYAAVQACIKGTHLQAVRRGNVIVVGPKQEQPSAPQQKKTVRGQVVDAAGNPLPGVSVMVKGTTTGTATDLDGNYSLSLPLSTPPHHNNVLVFTMIGMDDVEVRVGNRENINVTMEENAEMMDEVVVTGYQQLKKNAFTGNATVVTKDQLLKTNNKNAIAALQAFEPSFRLKEANLWGSDPNNLPEFTIRGESSIGMNRGLDVESARRSQRTNLADNPNLPIFILDGFEVSVQKIYDMDINRIESMTILKDAASTAIYGSRAANGVIVVTTVAPKPGELRVTYHFTVS